MQNKNISPGIGLENYKFGPKFYFMGITILTGIAAISFENFLLFHTIAEIFSIVIAFSIFIVTWNTRFISNNNYLLFLGILYLFVGILDLTHTLAYKGMNIFIGYEANLPTQLWIGTRYLESISLAIAPIFFTRRLNISLTFWIYLSLCTFILISLFVWPIFPDCFTEGSGLTAFKKNSEYIISLILSGAIAILYQKRDYLENSIFQLIVISLLLTIIGEIAFTFYVSVYGISNLFGHLFKIISFFLIYRAVIVVTLTTPYKSLFREIDNTNKQLEEEIDIRKKTEVDLKKALLEVKTLQGILPVCSYCKNIKDDKGAWSQIEAYISKYSDAKFSHSICPGCLEMHHPEIYESLVLKDKI